MSNNGQYLPHSSLLTSIGASSAPASLNIQQDVPPPPPAFASIAEMGLGPIEGKVSRKHILFSKHLLSAILF